MAGPDGFIIRVRPALIACVAFDGQVVGPYRVKGGVTADDELTACYGDDGLIVLEFNHGGPERRVVFERLCILDMDGIGDADV